MCRSRGVFRKSLRRSSFDKKKWHICKHDYHILVTIHCVERGIVFNSFTVVWRVHQYKRSDSTWKSKFLRSKWLLTWTTSSFVLIKINDKVRTCTEKSFGILFYSSYVFHEDLVYDYTLPIEVFFVNILINSILDVTADIKYLVV